MDWASSCHIQVLQVYHRPSLSGRASCTGTCPKGAWPAFGPVDIQQYSKGWHCSRRFRSQMDQRGKMWYIVYKDNLYN